MDESVICLKTTSATRLYTDLDILEAWKLIQRYSILLCVFSKYL
jgi:hypothetical protein